MRPGTDGPRFRVSRFDVVDLRVSENRGTLFWGPYNKDPLFRVLH